MRGLGDLIVKLKKHGSGWMDLKLVKLTLVKMHFDKCKFDQLQVHPSTSMFFQFHYQIPQSTHLLKFFLLPRYFLVQK